jgi:hypothetical protein
VERLQADAPNMRRPGADLIAHYLDPDRLPVHDRWSRKHADTQRRLCERFAAPVIAAVTCQDIKTEHTQKIVNAAPTAGEGDRVHRMLSALVSAGIDAGYLTSPRLARVHWQAGDRPLPAPAVSVAGESSLWIDPAEIPSDDDIARLGQALRDGALGERDELMANVAAYSGLRWGELAALTIAQVSHAARVITVDRKVVEVGGRLYAEAPKNRKFRCTIYPRRTPGGYPLAERLTARIEVLGVLSGASARCMTLRFTFGGELLQRISAGVVLLVAAVLARAGSEQAVLRNTCCATFRFLPAAYLLEQSAHPVLSQSEPPENRQQQDVPEETQVRRLQGLR